MKEEAAGHSGSEGMTVEGLVHHAEAHLRRLCGEVGGRHVGGEGNRAATDYFADIAASFGFETQSERERHGSAARPADVDE